MIHSILIANRGEIACRIIRTCRRLGIRAIAVYAIPDQHLPFVQAADEAIKLDGYAAHESYLDQDKILQAAQQSQADAIHPGFGFLSENAQFARRCREENILFIGPHPLAIEQMGLKSTAKAIMDTHGIPVIPGYHGDKQSVEYLKQTAAQIGYPILIKAVAGGGGKGMRIVSHQDDFETALETAQQEALHSFGNATILLERYFPNSKHIEFQIFGDQQGNIIHLLERDCSLQRRHQKIIEECPAPNLSEELRQQMGQAAIQAAHAINYDNAGTVEFLLNEQGEFFFLEMNTRLQVEHPVTEMVLGVDLVEWQILVAEGQTLPLKQEQIVAQNTAIECRLYAEDVLNNFFPSTGTILHWETRALEGVRYESGIQTGSSIGIYYDPMLAKIIAKAPTRPMAIRKLHYALSQLKCLGITTNQEFLKALLKEPYFQKGIQHSNSIVQNFDFQNLKIQQTAGQHLALIASCLYTWKQGQNDRQLIPMLPSGWRNNPYKDQDISYSINQQIFHLSYHFEQPFFNITIENHHYQVELLPSTFPNLVLVVNKYLHQVYCCSNEQEYYIQHQQYGPINVHLLPRFPSSTSNSSKAAYIAPMPSEVLRIKVEVGQSVQKGDSLLTLLSMKMETTIVAQEDGVIEELWVSENCSIPKGHKLLKIRPH